MSSTSTSTEPVLLGPTITLPIILDGTFFTLKSKSTRKDGKIVSISAKCQLCQTENIISGSLTGTTNFLTHLKRKHAESVPEYEKRKLELGPALKKKKHDSNKILEKNQKSLLSSGFSIKQKEISAKSSKTDLLILNFIVKGMHPLTTIEEKGFQDLVKGLNPGATIVSRRKLGRQIDFQFTLMKSKLMDILQLNPYCCLATDAWTCKGMSRAFLGVTVHWINTDLERNSAAIACCRFNGTHSYDRIAELFSSILKVYAIPLEKITKTVTDNGSNFVKAFAVYGAKEETEEQENKNVELELISEAESYEDLEFNDISEIIEIANVEQTDPRLPAHQRCASHTLGLICIKDVENISPKFQKSAFAKCYGIWNKISRSTKSSEKVKEIAGCLQVKPCSTRWNSFYDSVCSLLRITDKLDEICEALSVTKFSSPEIAFMQEYKQCTAPITTGLDRLQGDQNCYFGELIPTLLAIQSKLVILETSNLTYCRALTIGLLKGLRTRFKIYLELDLSEDNSKDAIIASVSHPYFKLRWIPDDSDKSDEIREIFIKSTIQLSSKMSRYSVKESSDIDKQFPNKTQNVKEKSDKFFQFTSATTSNQAQEKKTLESKVRVQCHQFLDDESEDTKMLDKYPYVKNIFIKFNTTLPSSGPVERLFYYAGMILSPKRRLLSDTLFEKMVLLKVNDF